MLDRDMVCPFNGIVDKLIGVFDPQFRDMKGTLSLSALSLMPVKYILLNPM